MMPHPICSLDLPGAQYTMNEITIRHDWTRREITALYDQPFNDLLYEAQTIHRTAFTSNQVQLSTLLSIKTGRCSEDCAYCSQSARHATELRDENLISVGQVLQAAREARDAGASRFCMGAAWRSPKDRDLPQLVEMVKGVKALGLETCLTAGMLSESQSRTLSDAGLDYYNHNLDTSPDYYSEIISTRTFQDRLDTLQHVREAGLRVCSGGIIGMGESRDDRIGLLGALANLPEHPDSVPINLLVPVKGTPLGETEPMDPFEFVRTVAVARILMPRSVVRLSAGRDRMSDEMHALCFFAGANSIFYGESLLTTPNAGTDRDRSLFARLGIEPAVFG